MSLGFDELCWALFDSDERKCLLLSLYGGANKRRGAIGEIIDDCKQLIRRRRKPERAYLAYLGLGRAYFSKGDVRRADAALRKSLRLSMKCTGRDPELYKWLGVVSAEKGKYQEALDYFRRASKFSSQDAQTAPKGLKYLSRASAAIQKQKRKLLRQKLAHLLRHGEAAS